MGDAGNAEHEGRADPVHLSFNRSASGVAA
jgi:hypothetical protein